LNSFAGLARLKAVMMSSRRARAWIATSLAVAAVLAFFFSTEKTRAQPLDGHATVQGAVAGGGSIIMDGDWLYVVRDAKLYKVQKSTMSVFQSVELN
jgi:hypothetical protein